MEKNTEIQFQEPNCMLIPDAAFDPLIECKKPKKGIPSPNCSAIPNGVFNLLLSCNTLSEVKIIAVILAETFMMNRGPTKISLSDFENKTELSRASIVNTTTVLIKKGFIEKEKIGKPGNEECFFSIKFKNGKVN